MGLRQTGELELLEKLKNKDESAFSELYSLYMRRIYAYALSILKSPMLAEDVTQDTFVKLWESAAFIQTDRTLLPYLFTIVRNKSLNVIRLASRESWITEEIATYAIDHSENPEQYAQRKQTDEYLTQAIDQLPPQRRMIYELCRNHGYTYKEAAKKLGIKDTTVNSQMVKALKSIRQYIVRKGALLFFF